MHVFPYSVRTGTAAARWKQLPAEVVQRRVQRLLDLDTELSHSYREQLIGKEVSVLIEQPAKESGFVKGRCGHYAEITLKTDRGFGSIVLAKVTQVQNGKTVAIPSLQIL